MDISDAIPQEALVPLNDVSEGRPVFFLPTMEGVAGPLRLLGQSLTVPAYCFQCVPLAPLTSLQDLAAFYVQKLKEKFPRGPYRIVGYSYGASVALEMGVCLQEREGEGAVETLLLVDGSHDYSRVYRDMYRKSYGVESRSLMDSPLFESEIVTNIAMRFSKIDNRIMRAQLLAARGWDERVRMAGESVVSAGVIDNPDIFKFICDGVRGRYMAADLYTPTTKFKGDLTLLRAEKGAAKEEDLGVDYGLQSLVDGTVEVVMFQGDHKSFVMSDVAKTAQAIMLRLH